MYDLKLNVCLLLVLFCKSSLAQNSDIQEELHVIKGQLQSLIGENNDLKKRTNELEHMVDLVIKENCDLKKRTNELEHKVNFITQNNVDLKWKPVAVERKVKHISLKTILRDGESKIMDKSKTIKSGIRTKHLRPKKSYTDNRFMDEKPKMFRNSPNYGESSILKRKQTNGDVYQKGKRLLSSPTTAGTTINGNLVAFTARVKNVITNVGDQQIIPFRTLESNFGQAFNAGTGVFSCPHNGVYAFFVTIVAFPNVRIEVEIVKDGVPVASAYSQGDSTRYGTGSSLAVIRLQRGDSVWVRDKVHYTSDVGTGNMVDPSFSSFTGFSLILQ